MAGYLPDGCTQRECDEAQPGYWDDDYDDYEPEPDPELCDHEEYEIGWEGRAMCHRCGTSWWATAAQIQAQREHEIWYAQEIERQIFREKWLWWWDRPKAAVARWFERWRLKSWHRRKTRSDIDDDIPF